MRYGSGPFSGMGVVADGRSRWRIESSIKAQRHLINLSQKVSEERLRKLERRKNSRVNVTKCVFHVLNSTVDVPGDNFLAFTVPGRIVRSNEAQVTKLGTVENVVNKVGRLHTFSPLQCVAQLGLCLPDIVVVRTKELLKNDSCRN